MTRLLPLLAFLDKHQCAPCLTLRVRPQLLAVAGLVTCCLADTDFAY